MELITKNDTATLAATARQRFGNGSRNSTQHLLIAKRLVAAHTEWYNTHPNISDKVSAEFEAALGAWRANTNTFGLMNTDAIWLARHYLAVYRKGE